MTAKREITRADILDYDAYGAVRAERRTELVATKQARRLHVGPFATFFFECYDTMWYQIQEMLRIERGGDEQLADELEAYNPLIPNGNDLVATVMLEITDEDERARQLAGLGGIENGMYIEIDGEEPVKAVPEDDAERTRADGKASSVQFVHFPFTERQKQAFAKPGARVVVGIDHPNYGHMARVPEEMRERLAEDFYL
ncbi:MAG: DUF3501 family protein [Proteobacteria bacterium]|nr:DUF3501 family protein [Pseudomonadota bacterium]